MPICRNGRILGDPGAVSRAGRKGATKDRYPCKGVSEVGSGEAIILWEAIVLSVSVEWGQLFEGAD